MFFFFFFNDTATTEIYTLSLHDALPISLRRDDAALHGLDRGRRPHHQGHGRRHRQQDRHLRLRPPDGGGEGSRSEEHTSELQSRQYLVCRLLLEKKKKNTYHQYLR